MSQESANNPTGAPEPASPMKENNLAQEQEEAYSPIKNVAKAIKTEQVIVLLIT